MNRNSFGIRPSFEYVLCLLANMRPVLLGLSEPGILLLDTKHSHLKAEMG